MQGGRAWQGPGWFTQNQAENMKWAIKACNNLWMGQTRWNRTTYGTSNRRDQFRAQLQRLACRLVALCVCVQWCATSSRAPPPGSSCTYNWIVLVE
jgi:hypothetical protein